MNPKIAVVEDNVDNRLLVQAILEDECELSEYESGTEVVEGLGAIFEAFQQAEAGTARQFGGTGLGLAISRSMCLLMGYDLTVESELGQGTTFKIVFPSFERTESRTLPAPSPTVGTRSPTVGASYNTGAESADPLAEALVAGEGPEVREEGGDLKHYKVLVIDDDEDSRVLMEDYLSDFGCEVLQTSSGKRGLEIVRSERPDLVTLDLHMPDMDGWEVLRRLKADPDVKHIPVVVASVAANEGRGRLFGAVDLLTKPIDRSALLRVMWRQLVNQDGRRVLVVEDDPEIHSLLHSALDGRGLDLYCVSNGAEALASLERETPAAILLDLRMPVMDGFEFLDRMRESRYHKGLPVIVITVKRLSPEEEAQLADKASAVVIKDQSFVPRVRAVLSTIFPERRRTRRVKTTVE